MKAKIQIVAGAVSLACLLLYTWVHTGGLLAGYVQPAVVGYVAAAGVELAVVSISLRIADLKKSQTSTRFFMFVLVSVVAVSALANVAEGFKTAQGEHMTLSTVQRLDILQAFIGLSATGLVSLIVLALSEIVGQDVNVAVNLAERERQRSVKAEQRKVSTTVEFDGSLTPFEQARAELNGQRERTKSEVLDILVDILGDEPDIGVSELAQRVNKSRTTIYGYLAELEQSGRIHRNGRLTVEA